MNSRSEVAVITGGASGFGLAIAACCADRGIRVALLDRDGERAENEAAALEQAHGVATLGMAVDIADDDAVRASAQVVLDRFERVDLVVSNVGVQLFGEAERLTDEEWRWLLDVNVVGAARVARAFLPMLRAAPRGRIAFTTSSSVLSPASRMAAYQASKFAVWGFAETLRLELSDTSVSVSTIFPSGMASRHLESSTAAQPEHVRRAIGEQQDFEAMAASNPDMVSAVASPERAADNVIAALLAGERYIVTHGDLVEAVDIRSAELRQAAIAARDA
jgi:NAD(P)-dependent dehydrogenase (short-subunit alcohol dehydrogenase family)